MSYLDRSGLERYHAGVKSKIKNLRDIIAEEYDSTAVYTVGDLCVYEGGLYVCTTAIPTAEAWTAAHWAAVTVGEEISDLKSDLNQKYEKPSTGIPASDLAQGVIPEVPVQDVQIDSVSILGQDGVANVPVAGISTYGVVKATSSLGIGVVESGTNEGRLFIDKANTTHIKIAADEYRPIVPQLQHISAFYGLTKAAGVDMASSNNAVGTYTDEAKVAIKSMLGVNDVVTDVTVSGTTPTITAVANTRYVCGEVATLDFTPSSTGICDVIFESGSTATVLTLPSTVKMPEWFDATALEADTIYEISIVDGVYGAVMSWQA